MLNNQPGDLRLAVMRFVRFLFSLRNVENLLHERGIDVSHEAVRYWWHRFDPLLAAEIKKHRRPRRMARSLRGKSDSVSVQVETSSNSSGSSINKANETPLNEPRAT